MDGDARAQAGEVRVYIRSAELSEARKAFVRVQLRRYVATTNWSMQQANPLWDEELRGFKVKRMSDRLMVKLLTLGPDGIPSIVDMMEMPVWKIDRAGEMRHKFSMNNGTPISMVLSMHGDHSMASSSQ